MLTLNPLFYERSSFFDDCFKDMDSFLFDTMKEPVKLFKTDIAKGNDSYVLTAELPGFSKDEVSIEVKDDVLTISASHKDEKDYSKKTSDDASKAATASTETASNEAADIESTDVVKSESKDMTKPGGFTYIRKERSELSYKRSFNIEGIDATGIKAKLENGILELTLPEKKIVEPEVTKIDLQ